MDREVIEEYLKRYHVGEQNAVTSREIEMAFAITGVEVRALVNQLRRSGMPIASSNRGYYYAANRQEVLSTINHMQRRIGGVAAAIRGLVSSLEEYDDSQLRLTEVKQ